MSTEETHSGIPTRAIHESYLDMQRSLKAYREAKDKQRADEMDTAHGELQQSVLTFYELLRPHIQHESGVNDWWDGKLPSYNGDGAPPDPEDGKGILQIQQNSDGFDIDPQRVDHIESLRGWHDHLGFNGNKRIQNIRGFGDSVFVVWHEYQLGLHHIDNWETSYHRKVVKKDSYMGKKQDTVVTKQRIPIDRLKRASRELSKVADKLGALSEFDASEVRTEITDELIDEVKEWEQQNLRN